MIALKNILVATDFGEAADAALAYGRELARTFDATLHVLNVADDVYVRLGGDAYVAVLPELQKDLEESARRQLDALLAHLLMGSVAERVVRTAPCPVLTVRHPEHEFVVPDALTTTAHA
jgi:nucleotide-binding universal stress UspA family protein